MTANTQAASSQKSGLPPLKLIKQITAYRTSQCIRVLVELGIPEMLLAGPKPVADLAASVSVQADRLERVLDHLVNEEVIGRDQDGSYVATEATRFLATGHDHSLASWVSFEYSPILWRPWEHMVDQLRSEKPAFDLVHGAPFFDVLARDAVAQKQFDDQMRDAALGIGSLIAPLLSFPAGTTIVDVGGGNGAFLGLLLDRNADTKGVLFELARSEEEFNPTFRKMLSCDRASVQRGSFFETFPTGGDVYLFSRVFHDFDDASAAAILKNARKAMQGQERLLLIDIVADEADARHRGSSQDIFMLTQLGGRERTGGEFSRLLADTGFTTVSLTPTAGPVSILEFQPAA